MTEELANALEDELRKDFPNAKPAVLNVRPVPKPVASLSEQWGILEKIESELRDRIRREHGTIIAEHDRRWVDIQNDYAQRISEEVARLEHLRDKELKELTEVTREKLRTHEILAERMGE